jgi:redox-sensitive bicupin YhaK (pirin superfamily)
MIIDRPSGARGAVKLGWLDSRHTFSFGHYHDPQWMGFGPLRVINDDRVAAGGGFPPHHHANMEILSYVLSGALSHKDSTNSGGVIRPGDLQWMSAGHGIEHSEFNASTTEPVHFLQIWIQPDRVNAAPAYAQRHFDPALRRGRWVLLASADGRDDSIAIRQQASVRGTLLAAGETVEFRCDPAMRYWLHVAQGAVRLGDRLLSAGDALGFTQESGTQHLQGVGAESPADVLLFELPL